MEPDDLLRLVVIVCKRLNLPYLVTGATATITYGEPRFTNDIDDWSINLDIVDEWRLARNWNVP